MDEPFAARDAQTRAKMQDFLPDVWRHPVHRCCSSRTTSMRRSRSPTGSWCSARPSRIETIVPIDLPRPRDPFSPQAEALRRHLTAQFQDKVDRAFAEQETLGVS
jgi:NitT/TauT family transport system ATP-binding protein